MEYVKNLTQKEAKELLENLKQSNYLDSGSSRAVYEIMYEGHHCVVKIAADSQGRFQNNQEITVWEDTNSCYLARVYASFQDIFTVMEYVEPFDWEMRESVSEGDLFDGEMSEEEKENLEDYYDMPFERLRLDAEELSDAASWLTEYVGYTSDNYQGGRNDDGDCKLYDYGYDSSVSSNKQVGDVNSCSNPIGKALEEVERGKPYEDDEWENEE